MSKTYSKSGNSLTISDDGSILVKPGDSLSKYSMAIYGNFNHIDEYLRKEVGMFKPIANVNQIFAGETLYHQPSIPSNGTVPPIIPPSGEKLDVNKIIRESGLPPESYDPIEWMIKDVRKRSAAVSLVGVFIEIGAIGAANALGSAFLGVLASCYALWKARNHGIRLAGMRGTTYGAVAWAFGHGYPHLPNAMIESLQNNPLNDTQAEIEVYKQNWNQAVSMSQTKLRNYCQSNNLDEELVKKSFQAWSLSYGKSQEPRAEWLSAGLLLDVAEQHFSGNDRMTFLQPWSWYPNDKYAGRPNYPPKIEARYPY